MIQFSIRTTRFLLLLVLLGTVSLPAAGQHFSNCLTQQDTGTSATVVVEDTVRTWFPNEADLDSGDEIALFTNTGTCAGRTDWAPGAEAVEITAAGPASTGTSGAPSGYAEDEPFMVTVWDASAGEEYDLGTRLTFAPCTSDLLCAEDGQYETDNIFTVTGLGDESTLPVTLVSFSSVRTGDRARLKWTTASETENAGFSVYHQHKSSGQEAPTEWTKIGFVEGSGNTSSHREYIFTTDPLAPGPHRFRLHQVDLDGTTTILRTVSIQRTLQSNGIVGSVVPNPVRRRGQLSVRVRRTQSVTVTLHNALGQRITLLHDGPLSANTQHRLVIDGNTLPSGRYLVRVEGETFTATRRLTLVR